MLNKKDQRIIRQMIRHIRTFPLSDSEIKQLEREVREGWKMSVVELYNKIN